MSYLESLFSLRGKNALVTGAASGLSRRCSAVLAQAGARIALVDVNQAGLAETAATIGEAVTLPADVTRSDEVGRMLTNAVEALGQIDIAVTCAGGAVDDAVIERFDELETCVPFSCCSAIPRLRAQFATWASKLRTQLR